MNTYQMESQLERQLEEVGIDFAEAITDRNLNLAREKRDKARDMGANIYDIKKMNRDIVQLVLDLAEERGDWNEYQRVLKAYDLDSDAFTDFIEDYERTELAALSKYYA